MIKKHVPIQIEGTALYCDGKNCGRSGPRAAYDDVEGAKRRATGLA